MGRAGRDGAGSGSLVHDKNWIVCDNGPASPFAGRCYVTWTDLSPGGDRIALAASGNGGLTWGAPIVLPRSNITGTQPAVQPNGGVAVPYLARAAIEVVRSTDGGGSLTPPRAISPLFSTATPGLRAPSLPSAAVAGDGRVFVAWQDCRFRPRCRAGDGANDIVVASSLDGAGWTAPTRVPIDAVSSGIDHVLLGLGVDATTRGDATRLGLTYYTLAPPGCAAPTCTLGAGFVSSRDAGRTWSAPVPLGSRSAFGGLADASGGRFVGDYVSTSFVGGVAVPVYSIATAPFDGRFHQFVFSARVPPLPARPAVSIARFRATPARPRAGRGFAVTATLQVSGSPVGARLACRATLGGRGLAAVAASLAPARATCLWRLPARTRGLRLSGSLQVVDAGGAARRTFSYRVA